MNIRTLMRGPGANTSLFRVRRPADEGLPGGLILLSLLLIIMLSLPAVIAQAAEQDPAGILTGEDFKTAKVARGAGQGEQIFHVQISSELPPYQFRLIPDPSPNHQWRSGYPPRHVGRIEISSGKSVIQTIEVRTQADATMFIDYFTMEDINFDGFLDIAVVYDFGAKWEALSYWLFDPKTKRFVKNSLTVELRRLLYAQKQLVPQSKAIRITAYAGVCPQEKTYQIAGQHLVLTEVVARTCTIEGTVEKTKRRINGKLRLVKTTFLPR